MAQHLLVVITNPSSSEEEAEYNRWYDEEHLADVLKVPGFVAAQRFKLVADAQQPMPGPYLALYEMETDDPQAAVAGLQAAAAAGTMIISPALDMERIVTSLFSPIGARVVAPA